MTVNDASQFLSETATIGEMNPPKSSTMSPSSVQKHIQEDTAGKQDKFAAAFLYSLTAIFHTAFRRLCFEEVFFVFLTEICSVGRHRT